MEFTDQISILIFSLVMLAVAIFLLMSKVIIGPLAKLKKTERIVLSLSLIGTVMVVFMAAASYFFMFYFSFCIVWITE